VKNGYIYCKTFYRSERRLVLEDRELIRRVQNGQTEYLNEIAGRYYDDIYYFCCYQTGSREDAYDLTQETFFRFIRYVEHYRYRNLKGYLLTIAMNLCREYMRTSAQTRLREAHLDSIDQNTSLPDKGPADPASHEEASENAILLADALQKLPETQREAVLLHHFYGYKNREISHMTGASYDAVKSRIRQGLDKLGRMLDPNDFCLRDK
jgi:RNA polymerase sigma factor (sigma-70 family)